MLNSVRRFAYDGTFHSPSWTFKGIKQKLWSTRRPSCLRTDLAKPPWGPVTFPRPSISSSRQIAAVHKTAVPVSVKAKRNDAAHHVMRCSHAVGHCYMSARHLTPLSRHAAATRVRTTGRRTSITGARLASNWMRCQSGMNYLLVMDIIGRLDRCDSNVGTTGADPGGGKG